MGNRNGMQNGSIANKSTIAIGEKNNFMRAMNGFFSGYNKSAVQSLNMYSTEKIITETISIIKNIRIFNADKEKVAAIIVTVLIKINVTITKSNILLRMLELSAG